MNKTLVTLIPVMAIGAAIALAAWPRGAHAEGTDSGVRVVDLEAIIQKSSKAKAIMDSFRQLQDKKRADIKKKEQQVTALQKTLTRESPPEALDEYGRKVREIQMMMQEAETDIQQEFLKTREQLLTALRPTLEAYGRENGVGILLDKTTGGVVYAAPALDVTRDIEARMK